MIDKSVNEYGDWEFYHDDAYFGKWGVKMRREKNMLKVIHVKTKEEAEVIAYAFNTLEFIVDLGFDFDGENTVDGLKRLITEIVEMAKSALQLAASDDNGTSTPDHIELLSRVYDETKNGYKLRSSTRKDIKEYLSYL